MAALDRIYRSILVATRFFSRGWGPTHAYESLARFNPTLVSRDECAAALLDHTHPISLSQVNKTSWGTTCTGAFVSPTVTLLPDTLPPEAEMARFELLLPSERHRPVYIHLAGTGDHGFSRRRVMTALPLLKSDRIGALILENPFYGSRKPRQQTRSQLLHVSDLFILGVSLMLECLVLKKWLEGDGWGPVGMTGISMGGHNAALCGAVWPEPVPVVPFLSWSTASSAFTQGILSGAVCWNVLEEQLALSSDKVRKNIFDFAISHQEILRENNSNSTQDRTQQVWGDSEDSAMASNMWMTSSDSERQDTSKFDRTLEHRVPAVTYSWLNTKAARESCPHHWKTVDTLRAVLDFSTHLYNYPVPLNTQLAQFLVAKQDLYIPRSHISSVQSTWPGCEVNYLDGGHVSSTVFQQKAYRAILATKMQNKMAT